MVALTSLSVASNPGICGPAVAIGSLGTSYASAGTQLGTACAGGSGGGSPPSSSASAAIGGGVGGGAAVVVVLVALALWWSRFRSRAAATTHPVPLLPVEAPPGPRLALAPLSPTAASGRSSNRSAPHSIHGVPVKVGRAPAGEVAALSHASSEADGVPQSPSVGDGVLCDRHQSAHHDIFLCYRAASEGMPHPLLRPAGSGLAGALCEALEAPGAVPPGRPPLAVFWDVKCQADEDLWESAVQFGLSGSTLVIPLITRPLLDSIVRVSTQRRDNFLLGTPAEGVSSRASYPRVLSSGRPPAHLPFPRHPSSVPDPQSLSSPWIASVMAAA